MTTDSAKLDALIARLEKVIVRMRGYTVADAEVVRDAAAAIARLRDELAEVDTEMKRAHAGWEDAILRAEKAESALAERDKDAERYRWLREFGNDGQPHIIMEQYVPALSPLQPELKWLYREDADAAIDAAMQGKP